VTEQTGATYTFDLADAWTYIEFNRATAITATVPPNSSVAYPIGTEIACIQSGAGQLTIAEGAGVTINEPTSLTLIILEQHGSWHLKKVGTDEWNISGDLEPA
jgi:hypothetical protein